MAINEDVVSPEAHKFVTSYGYKKPDRFSDYRHPDGHSLKIDRNNFVHKHKSGTTSRGVVQHDLPPVIRKTHPNFHGPATKMAYEGEHLDIYNSKRKDAADNTMSAKGTAKRFEKDTRLGKGDWGNTQKKFAPGPTYEEDRRDNPRFKKKCPASNDRHDWEWSGGKGFCDNCGAEHPQNKKLKEGTMNDLLRAVIQEAKAFDPVKAHPGDIGSKLDIDACNVCGKVGHPASAHQAKALADKNQVTESTSVEPKVIGHFIQTHVPSGKKHRGAMMDTHMRELGNNVRLSTGEKVTKDHILNHWNASQPETYKYEWDSNGVKEDFKKWADDRQNKREKKATTRQADLVKWRDGTKDLKYSTPKKKKLLFGDEKIMEGNKKKKWDKNAHIKAIARNTIGQVKKGQTITPKKFKKAKYKETFE